MAENKEKVTRKPRTKATAPKEVAKTITVKEELKELAEKAEETLLPSTTVDKLTNPAEAELKDPPQDLSKDIEKDPEKELTKLDPESKEISDPAGFLDEVGENLASKADDKELPGTELPKDVTPFEDYSPKGTPAEVFKLNPYLEDGQSKWLARVSANGLVHKLFKGSYAKAYNAAKNYNLTHGFADAEIRKVRTK